MNVITLLLTVCLTADAAGEVRIPAVVVTLIDQVDVPAQESGVLLKRLATEGQVVEEGQVLGQIDDREIRLLRTRAEAELEQARRLAENDLKVRFAQKSSEVAKAELKRAQDSVEKFPKSVSQTELDRLQLLADKAALEIEQAQEDLADARIQQALKQHDVERTRLQQERRRIVAPITGVVVQWKKHQGEWLEPGAPVVRVIRMHKLRAEGFAPAGSLSADAVGRRVTLTVQDMPVTGELVFVSPEIDPVNNQVRFWAEVDNPQLKLRPGQSGVLVIHPIKK
ncbi:MAG: HlyD family efflux transporter periplasmic adaptor subunit [Planctomycetaceae bacterium]|nr:HlyD family efflux transporter periplasmic adaptor subunit [Planctomycetaceae bacterium]